MLLLHRRHSLCRLLLLLLRHCCRLRLLRLLLLLLCATTTTTSSSRCPRVFRVWQAGPLGGVERHLVVSEQRRVKLLTDLGLMGLGWCELVGC